MVEDDVHDDLDVVRLGRLQKRIEVAHGAVLRIDGLIVGDVIAEVDLRRRIHGRDPDGVDAEGLQVFEAAFDTLDVAPSVAVGILKAAGVDLVDHGVLPPGVCTGVADNRLFLPWRRLLCVRQRKCAKGKTKS